MDGYNDYATTNATTEKTDKIKKQKSIGQLAAAIDRKEKEIAKLKAKIAKAEADLEKLKAELREKL